MKFPPGCKNEVIRGLRRPGLPRRLPTPGTTPAYVTLTWSVYLAMRERLARLEAAQTGVASHRRSAALRRVRLRDPSDAALHLHPV